MPTATAAERRIETLLELHLRPSLFIPELKNKRKSAVLEEMVAHLASQKVAHLAEPVLEVVRQREALGSTGIGKGIAIPHARSTMVAERAVLLARSVKGVVAPPTEQDPIYLQLLAEIVKSVRLAPARKRILEAQDLDQIRTIIGAQLAND